MGSPEERESQRVREDRFPVWHHRPQGDVEAAQAHAQGSEEECRYGCGRIFPCSLVTHSHPPYKSK